MRPGVLRRPPLDGGPAVGLAAPGRFAQRCGCALGGMVSLVARRCARVVGGTVGLIAECRARVRPGTGVGAPGVEDRLPPGAAAKVGDQRPSGCGPVIVVAPARVQRRKPADDPGRAEPALTGPGVSEGPGPAAADIGVEPVQGGDPPPHNPAGRSHAGHPGLPVHQHRAAAALPLRAAPVLHRPDARLLAYNVQQSGPLVGNGDSPAVHHQLETSLRVSHHCKATSTNGGL